jgi:photosynthetic reaction center H subunit
MEYGAITSHIDVAQIVLYAFWIFFAGLLFYLRKEDRREGYPLLSEVSGRPENHGIFMPEPKTFRLADGRTVQAPNPSRADTREPAAAFIVPWPGGPLWPTGEPMGSGVGPGSYAVRSDVPDVTFEGHTRLAPMRIASGYTISDRDPDPRGMEVIGADGEKAGTVADIWVDRSECLIRYLEVELSGAGAGANGVTTAAGTAATGATGVGRRVLLPLNFARVDRRRRRVDVDAILASHFAGVPSLRSPDKVTLLEEDRIVGYYGGGTLFAKPSRAEAWI